MRHNDAERRLRFRVASSESDSLILARTHASLLQKGCKLGEQPAEAAATAFVLLGLVRKKVMASGGAVPHVPRLFTAPTRHFSSRLLGVPLSLANPPVFLRECLKSSGSDEGEEGAPECGTAIVQVGRPGGLCVE